MWALVVLAIYLTPFFLLGWAIDVAMKRYAVDLRDVQSQAGVNRAPRKVFLWALGGLKSKSLSASGC
jgi:hypothetical protein